MPDWSRTCKFNLAAVSSEDRVTSPYLGLIIPLPDANEIAYGHPLVRMYIYIERGIQYSYARVRIHTSISKCVAPPPARETHLGLFLNTGNIDLRNNHHSVG